MTGLLQNLRRADVEDFLYAEAELLDTWQLTQWRELFTSPCTYIVPNLALPGDAPAENILHLVVDDEHHLTERVKRLGKKTAHAEFPRSRCRRFISNVRIVERAEDHVRATANFITYRNNHEVTDTYYGQHQYVLVEEADQLRIREKRTILDIGSLRPQGRLSIIV